MSMNGGLSGSGSGVVKKLASINGDTPGYEINRDNFPSLLMMYDGAAITDGIYTGNAITEIISGQQEHFSTVTVNPDHSVALAFPNSAGLIAADPIAEASAGCRYLVAFAVGKFVEGSFEGVGFGESDASCDGLNMRPSVNPAAITSLSVIGNSVYDDTATPNPGASFPASEHMAMMAVIDLGGNIEFHGYNPTDGYQSVSGPAANNAPGDITNFVRPNGTTLNTLTSGLHGCCLFDFGTTGIPEDYLNAMYWMYNQWTTNPLNKTIYPGWKGK